MSSSLGQTLSMTVSAVAIALVAIFLWPKQRVIEAEEIRLVSPDGRRMIRLSVTNGSANICASRTDGSQMILLSSNDHGDEITLGGVGGETAIVRMTTMDDSRIGSTGGASIKFLDRHGNVQKQITRD